MQAAVDVGATSRRSRKPPGVLVDCDVHSRIAPADVERHLPAAFRARYRAFGLRALKSMYHYPRYRNRGCRLDSFPADGGLPGSDLGLMQEQLLDRYEVDFAILNPQEGLEFAAQEPEYAAALTSALNDWTQQEWLDKDARLRAGITVPFEDPHRAVREIHRMATDRRFVHVYLGSRTDKPLGHPKYWPIFEAAAEHELAITVHVGDLGSGTVTGAGWPSFYFEDHVAFASSIEATAVSLVCRGVFAEFPTLNVVLEEGGVMWAPALMWALDNMADILRIESPRMDLAPSEYFRRNLYFTTQPIEEPPRRGNFTSMLRALDMDSHILFSSDYPHWDFDDPERALPPEFGPEIQARILGANACELFRLQAP